MSDARLAYALGCESIHLLENIEQDFGRLMWYAGFEYHAISAYFGIMAMEILGFGSEAAEICAEVAEQFKEKDPTGKSFDIAKS